MHIDTLHITKHKVLEGIEINFNIPSEGANSLNLLVGVNGCGKTSILELLFLSFSGNIGAENKDSDFELKYDNQNFIVPHKISPNLMLLNNEKQHIDYTASLSSKYSSENTNVNGIDTSPKIIYLPAHLEFNYQLAPNLPTTYQFINRINSQTLLGFAETYIRDFILTSERQSTKGMPEDRKKDAIDKFNAYFENTEFVTKLFDLDNNLKPIFNTITNEIVTIDKLSSGEKQLYARVISLMILNPHNSIILIDEPEISLHPTWQQTILKIYENIGTNNQFIIATHSPHIIMSAKYSDLIVLYKDNNKIKTLTYHDTFVQSDINNILEEVMQVSSVPVELKILYKKYREYVEKKEENIDEAKKIKKQILQFESSSSEFMQNMNFLIMLRD